MTDEVPSYIQQRPNRVALKILLTPRASRSRVIGEHDGYLKIAVVSPPVDGEANQALVNFLAKKLRIPKGAVILVDGHRSRRKLLEIDSLSPGDIHALLNS